MSRSSTNALAERLASHLQHVRHQIGGRVHIGAHDYAMRGYTPFRFGGDWTHEPHMQRVLADLLRDRDGAFVDVGANYGQTLALLLAIDPARRYIGFEPQLACCQCIDQFIADNRLSHMQVMPLALSDANATARFHVSHPGDLLGSLDPAHHALQSGATTFHTWVSTRVGDEVLAEIGANRIALVKVDVEGAEHRVLQGLARTLATQRPALVFEFLPNFVGEERTPLPDDACHEHREHARTIEALLGRCGYVLQAVAEDGSRQPVAHLALDDAREYVSYNYVALPAPLTS